jgi:hypothetical protein
MVAISWASWHRLPRHDIQPPTGAPEPDAVGYRSAVKISRAARRPVIALRRHGQVTPAVPGDTLVTVSVGPSGAAVALWASPQARQALHTPAAAGGQDARRPVAARVVAAGSGTSTVVHLAALDLPFCRVQPLPDGHVLVVASRGGRAVEFDADGVPVRAGSVGDGIEHMLTTPTGRVWIGYFDEGVYGDDPVAQHGIARFNRDLTAEWVYPDGTGFDQVDDCYSLNVVGETAWACFYDSFPIVRLDGAAVTGWHNSTRGVRALLVAADTCALIGGYPGDRDRVVVGRLAAGRYEPGDHRRLVLPDGRPVPDDVRIIGRGPDLHVFVGPTWYRLGLDDLR